MCKLHANDPPYVAEFINNYLFATGGAVTHFDIICACPTCRGMSVNDVLDQLERENFFNANVYILPPDNDESDGDSEDSDDEQSVCRPFADHLSPQILKGEGSAEVVDEYGSHVLASCNREETPGNVAVVESASEVNSDSSLTAGFTCAANAAAATVIQGHSSRTSSSERKKRQLTPKVQKTKRSKLASEQQAGTTAATTSAEPAAACTSPVHTGLPRIWRKNDLTSKQYEKFSWSGATADNLPDLQPSEYFELFWDNALFQKIQDFSKLYAIQQDPRSSFSVTVEELKVVVGILLISGYNTVPRRRLYWSCENDVRNDMIASAMSRNRFDEILSKLHCADNAELPELDRFGKVRPLIGYLNEKFLTHWPLSQQLSIDESMIPYYGHHGCKQHIHGKPVRFGFKIWSLNSAADGYCCQFEPYQGAGSGMKIEQLGLGGSVVVDLISRLPSDQHYHVFADNFFSSLTLVDHLTRAGVGYTGTIRENRMQKCPVMAAKDLGKKKRGEYDYRQDEANDFLLVKWHDNAVVSVVSNCHGIEPLRSAARWSAKEKKELNITVPNVVHQYNRFMGGTDLMDRNISNYRVTIHMKKWWWSVFSFMLSASVVNAWCIHRLVKTQKLDLLSFTRQIAISYVLNHSRRPEIGRPPMLPRPMPRPTNAGRRVVPDAVRKSAGHYPVSVSQNRCRVCQKNTKRGCGKCGVNLHDCCYMIFHSSWA